MRAWSLTVCEDGSIDTDLYLTERQCYEALARDLFGEDGKVQDVATLDHLTTLAMGSTTTDIDEIAKAFEDAVEEHCIPVYYAVTAHDHPWTFGPEPSSEYHTRPFDQAESLHG